MILIYDNVQKNYVKSQTDAAMIIGSTLYCDINDFHSYSARENYKQTKFKLIHRNPPPSPHAFL